LTHLTQHPGVIEYVPSIHAQIMELIIFFFLLLSLLYHHHADSLCILLSMSSGEDKESLIAGLDKLEKMFCANKFHSPAGSDNEDGAKHPPSGDPVFILFVAVACCQICSSWAFSC